MIDQLTIDHILDAANIYDVVSEFVTLRKRGVNYVGLCPFHSDKTPSFYVSPAKNICKCFACGEGGTAVHFIMKHEQLSYFDALRFLAKKYNIEIQERELTDKEKLVRSDRESMLIVNGWAQQYFSTQLHGSSEGKDIGYRYFAERGFRDDIIRKFQLGYSLEQRDALYLAATKGGYKQEFLERIGLIITYENGNVNDRFRGRVIFPVHTISGKVVAFGGRTLKKDDKTAKYINSPESEIYHKSNELYGIYFAKQPIVKADRCYLVEGYTDVISMHQVGVENVVASSGTALTHGQIRLIKRFTNNITVLYDGDAAGIKAAIRGIDMLLEEGMNIKVLLLPDGEDPDSFARKHNATAFHEFIQQNEVDFIRFKTRLLLNEAGGDPVKRSALITDIIQSVAIIPDNIARSVYIRECSAMLEVDERLLLHEVNKVKLKKDEKRVSSPTTQPESPIGTSSNSYSADVFTVSTQIGEVPPSLDNIPPPNPEDYPMDEADMQLLSVMDETIRTPIVDKLSSFEPYELSLLRYVVRYGERDLFNYEDEESGEKVIWHVADYIHFDLERDDLSFQTPLFKMILEEASVKCKEENFVASRYFLAHPNPLVSRLAANLICEKYQLSKYHTRFREIEQEEDKLTQIVLKDIYALKDAYIIYQIKETQNEIKKAHISGDQEKVIQCMMQLTKLNEVKNVLCKELGERIILKM